MNVDDGNRESCLWGILRGGSLWKAIPDPDDEDLDAWLVLFEWSLAVTMLVADAQLKEGALTQLPPIERLVARCRFQRWRRRSQRRASSILEKMLEIAW